jgi:chromosome segregation ATPase
MENLNIDQLIQELRSVYDGLKMSKSELNKKIRTLNNAVSRKDRKEKEYNSYEAKADMTKENIVNSSRGAYDDITKSTANLERNFSSYKNKIKEIVVNVSLLEKSGDLTKAQQASVNLFNQFSIEVIEYFDNNINELKNWKYDSLKKFLKEESPEGQFQDETFMYEKMNDALGLVNGMLDLSHDLKGINEEYNKSNNESKDKLDYLWSNLNSSEEESKIVEVLLKVAQNLLDNTNEELEGSIKSGKELSIKEADTKAALDSLDKTSETYEADYADLIDTLRSIKEVSEKVRAAIAKYSKVKEESENKIKSLQKSKAELTAEISKMREQIEAIELEGKNNDFYYQTTRESKMKMIDSMYSEFLNKRSSVIKDSFVDYMKLNGLRMDWAITSDILSKISDYGNFEPMNDISNWIGDMKWDEKNIRSLSFDMNFVDFANRDLVKGSDWLKDEVMSSGEFQWINSSSYALNENFYGRVIEYLNQLRDISEYKGMADRKNSSINKLRSELSKILDIKDSKLEEMSMLDNQIIDIQDKLQIIGSDLDKLQQELNELDSTDINYLDNWKKIKENILSTKQKQGEAVNEQKEVDHSREKINLYIGIYLDEKINTLNSKISLIDDEVRNMFVEIRNLESSAKESLQELDPEDGQLVNNMSDIKGDLYYFNDEFSYELVNKIKNSVAINYDEFVSSNFGFLIECLGVDLGYIDNVLPKLEEFIIYFN